MADEETTIDDDPELAEPERTEDELTDEELAAVETVFERFAEGQSLQEALEIQPAYVEAMEVAAHHLYENGKFDEATVLIEGIMALDDERYYPYLLIGDYYLTQEDDYDEALRYLLAAHEFGPDDPGISYKVGETLLRKGEPEQSAKFFNEAILFGSGQPEDNPFAQRAQVLLSNMQEAAESYVEDGEIN